MASLNVNPGEKDPRRIVDVVRQLVEGQSNAVGAFTLTVSAASTVVPAPTCAPGSVILASPQTANAAAAFGTTWFVAAKGQFTVNHANNAQADRTFGFLVAG